MTMRPFCGLSAIPLLLPPPWAPRFWLLRLPRLCVPYALQVPTFGVFSHQASSSFPFFSSVVFSLFRTVSAPFFFFASVSVGHFPRVFPLGLIAGRTLLFFPGFFFKLTRENLFSAAVPPFSPGFFPWRAVRRGDSLPPFFLTCV